MNNELPSEDYAIPSTLTVKELREFLSEDDPFVLTYFFKYAPDTLSVKCRYVNGYLESISIPKIDFDPIELTDNESRIVGRFRGVKREEYYEYWKRN